MSRKPRPRPPNPAARPWRWLRMVTQMAALLLFLALLIVTRGGEFPSAPPDLFFRRAALAGNLTLMILDPISVLTRGLASFFLPGFNQVALGLEQTLYDVPWL